MLVSGRATVGRWFISFWDFWPIFRGEHDVSFRMFQEFQLQQGEFQLQQGEFQLQLVTGLLGHPHPIHHYNENSIGSHLPWLRGRATVSWVPYAQWWGPQQDIQVALWKLADSNLADGFFSISWNPEPWWKKKSLGNCTNLELWTMLGKSMKYSFKWW